MRTIEIDEVEQDNVDLRSLTLAEVAFGGEVGIGGFDREDAAEDDVPAMKQVIVTENEATPDRLYTGYVGKRDLARGEGVTPVELQRTWDVMLLDINTVLDDEVFRGDNANRPEETDFARVSWLLTTGAISALGITAGVVPNSNTVTMDAIDYRGKGPRQVLNECAEAAAKNYFLYDWGDGPKLYYDKHSGNSLSSTLKISTVLSDVDNETVFAPTRPRLEKDPTRIYSTIRFAYEGGVVWVDRQETEDEFRRHEVAVEDSTVKSQARATNKANKYLTAASSEELSFSCELHLPADKVNDVRAGMRIEFKCPHLSVHDFAWFRITRRVVSPQADAGDPSAESYTLYLEFADDIKMTSFGAPRPGKDPGVLDATVEPVGDPLGVSCYNARFRERHIIDNTEFDFLLRSICAFTSDDAYVGSIVWFNVPHGSTNCSLSLGAWDGRSITEAWFGFDPGALDDDEVGVEVSVPAADTFIDDGAVGGSTAYIAGAASSEPTDINQYAPLGQAACGVAQTWHIPRSRLVANQVNWFVVAPTTRHALGFWCVADYATPDQYGGGGFQPKQPSARTVKITSSGRTPWLAGIGAIDGVNRTFELINWNGSGRPDARIGVIILGQGDYTYDGTAKTVTLNKAPAAGTDVRFRYMAAV